MNDHPNKDEAEQIRAKQIRAKRIRSNVVEVRQRIDDAATRSGRDADKVHLIAVTKYVDAPITKAVVEAGCADVGENRPQVLWDKAQELAALEVNWHMIGHLQRNKVKRTVECAGLIHSVDSLRLLDAINEAGTAKERVVRVLLEVNVSGEQAKHGFAPGELPAALEHVANLNNVAIDGLMCMAGWDGDKDQARREFEMLRRLLESHAAETAENVRLNELSMGMSGDFETAIEEGATMVRVGSLLFRGVT